MAITWINHQLVGDIGAEGTWDDLRNYVGMFILDGSTYKQYYSGVDSTSSDNQIIYADSPDRVNWSNHQQVVPRDSLNPHDTNSTFRPCVIKDGSTYKMWYAGLNSGAWTIIYATSTDGLTWTGFQQVVTVGSEGTWDTTHAGQPWVIKDGSTYKLWYAGFDGTEWSIIYATSSNGTSWSGFQRVLAKGAEGTYDTTHVLYPSVVKVDSTYTMLYGGNSSGVNRVIFTDSSDGINWANHELSIDKNTEGTWDAQDSHAPGLYWSGSRWFTLYSGRTGGIWRMLYAEQGEGSADARDYAEIMPLNVHE